MIFTTKQFSADALEVKHTIRKPEQGRTERILFEIQGNWVRTYIIDGVIKKNFTDTVGHKWQTLEDAKKHLVEKGWVFI